ncbi:hypothetical protein L4C34_01940 [Vibrio profundum]|uniref:hypothetical protein n=1 Tax=Vibrio profundum TaxID=2910247 RepID=UPI003D129AF0
MTKVDTSSYQMAIDLLCCHLGLSEDEARRELGITKEQHVEKTISECQRQLALSMSEDK